MKQRDKVAIGWLDPGHVDGMFALAVAQIYSQRREPGRRPGSRVEAGGTALLAEAVTSSLHASWTPLRPSGC